MKRLMIVALLLVGCVSGNTTAPTTYSYVSFWHDDVRGVGCWVRAGGLSCLPDSEYRHD